MSACQGLTTAENMFHAMHDPMHGLSELFMNDSINWAFVCKAALKFFVDLYKNWKKKKNWEKEINPCLFVVKIVILAINTIFVY